MIDRHKAAAHSWAVNVLAALGRDGVRERIERMDEHNPIILGVAFVASCKRLALRPSAVLRQCERPWSDSTVAKLLGIDSEER